MTKKQKEEKRLLVLIRIEEIWKRIDEIDATIKKDGEVWSLYNWAKAHPMPSLDNEEDKLSIYDVYDFRHKGLEEERRQLFEIYLLSLKELRELEKEMYK